jgi:hypothetical protein
MAEFLSERWFAELATTLQATVVGHRGGMVLALGQIVTGTPAGEVAFTVRLGGGEPGVLRRDGTGSADVILVADLAAARAIAAGRSAGELLAEGRIKVRGDLNALLRASEELTALAAALAATDD